MGIIELLETKENLRKYRPAKQEDINIAQKELNLTFSNEYINYLKKFGIAIFDSHELTGLCDGKRLDVVKNTIEQRFINKFVPINCYVVESLDIDGVVIWQDSKGNIYQSIPNGDFLMICSSLVEYVSEDY